MADTQTGRITVKCECGAKLGLLASFVGQKAKCPKCQRSFVVPAPSHPVESSAPAYPSPPTPDPEPTEAAEELMKVSCPCGKRIRVPANATGRKARCPVCHNVFVVGQTPASPTEAIRSHPHVQPATPEPEEYEEQDEAAGWSESEQSLLSEAEQQAGAAGGVSCKLCPNCGQTMPLEARLCVACGFDTKSGRRLQEATVSGTGSGGLTAVGGVLGSVVRSGGAILLGTLLSLIGAMLGAALWAVIAISIHLELGYIAWAIGGLAGGGMYLGFRNQNTLAGLIASAMAILGIVTAKVAIFVYLIAAAFSTMADNLPTTPSGDEQSQETVATERSDDLDRHVLAVHHADLLANRQGLSYDDPKREAIHKEQQKKFQAMSSEQVAKASADLEAWNQGRKWEDSSYVRDFLIYYYIDEAIAAESESEDSETEDLGTTPAQWKKHYQTAVKRVDGIPADERLVEAKQIEEKEQAGNEELASALVAEAARSMASIFFQEMFGLFDIIFVLLAVGTAYHLASGLSFGG